MSVAIVVWCVLHCATLPYFVCCVVCAVVVVYVCVYLVTIFSTYTTWYASHDTRAVYSCGHGDRFIARASISTETTVQTSRSVESAQLPQRVCKTRVLRPTSVPPLDLTGLNSVDSDEEARAVGCLAVSHASCVLFGQRTTPYHHSQHRHTTRPLTPDEDHHLRRPLVPKVPQRVSKTRVAPLYLYSIQRRGDSFDWARGVFRSRIFAPPRTCLWSHCLGDHASGTHHLEPR